MLQIVRSIAHAVEIMAGDVTNSRELIALLSETYPNASYAELRRGALYALTRPGINPDVVSVIYDCAIRL